MEQDTRDGSPEGSSSVGVLARIEDGFLSLVLLVMVLVPIAEVALRAVSSTGISGSTSIVQHGTLLVSMLGAAVAAREKRLLALASGALWKGRLARLATIGSSSVAACVAAILTAASFRFVLEEHAYPQPFVYGIPLWVVESVMPIGFALITWRLVRTSAATWARRALTFAITAALVAIVWKVGVPNAGVAYATGAVLLFAGIAGAPIFALIGGAALILNVLAQIPIASMSISHYSLVVNPSLPAIPLFTVAGYVLAEGGAPKRLIAVFESSVGRFRAGPALVTVLACAFFTTFTGGSGVTILALGGLLLPILTSAGYGERDAVGLLTGAGSLGILFAPCLPLILYAIVAEVPLEQMFLGGALPGVLLVALVIAWAMTRQAKIDRPKADARTAWRTIWIAKWELLLPVVVTVALFGGFATPVEAAALTALYAIVVEVFIYRDYPSLKRFASVLTQSGLLVGGILVILGVALGLTSFLVDAQIPTRAAAWVHASVSSKIEFLLLLNLFLIVVGCLMDIFSAIVVVAPLIVPIGIGFGIDPVHLGIIFLANLELGYLTPPVGMNLFISSYRFKRPLVEVYRASFPILVVLLIGVILITYVPVMTTWLPHLVGR